MKSTGLRRFETPHLSTRLRKRFIADGERRPGSIEGRGLLHLVIFFPNRENPSAFGNQHR
jgi:hypothetical protein